MVRIRKAVLSDAQHIRALETRVWTEEVTSKYDIATFVSYGYVFVAESEGALVGAIVAIEQKQGGIYVMDLVVDSNFRREGVGRKLYERLLGVARLKKKIVQTHVGKSYRESYRLHTNLGAEEIGIHENPYGLEVPDEPRRFMQFG